MPIKIKAGYLVLITAHDEDIRQDFVTWQQTVWVAPGAYDVFAYLA